MEPRDALDGIEVFPLLRSDLSDEKKRAYQERLFGEVLQHYLECVVAGVRFFATTGTAVIKDQFGICQRSTIWMATAADSAR